MEASNIEQLMHKVLNKLQLFVTGFTDKNKLKIGNRLDAMLQEKAKEAGVPLVLKKPINWIRIALTSLGATATLAAVIALVLFVPGPWTRLFARPIIVSMDLVNVDFSFNGLAADKPQLKITSPKAIRGVQFVKANLKVTPSVPLDVVLSADKTTILVTPKEALKKGVSYTMTIKPGVLFDDGSYLVNEQAWVIPTKAIFDVVSLSPRDGAEAPKNATFEIAFTTDEFDLDAVTKNVSIFPAVDGKYEKIASRVVFMPSKNLQPGGAYTFTVSKAVTNKAGEAIPNDYSVTFRIKTDTVNEEEVVPGIIVDQQFVNVSSGQSLVSFYTYKIDKVNATAYQLSWDEAKTFIEGFIRQGVLNPEPALKGKKSSASKTITGSGSEYSDQFMYEYSLSGLKNGLYVVKLVNAKNSKMIQYIIAAKGDLGVYATTRLQNSDVDVWSFDYTTLLPAKDVSINVAGCTETGCTSVTEKTPDSGYVQIKTSSVVTYVLASKGDSVAFLFPGLGYGSYNGFGGSSLIDRSFYSKVIVSKPAYTPGSLLKYSVILRQKVGDEYKKIPQGTSFTVALCPYWDGIDQATAMGTTSRCVDQKEIQISDASTIDGMFKLWDRREDLVLFVWKNANGKRTLITSESISVAEMDKNQVQVTLQSNKSRYVGKEVMEFTGRVTNYVGAGIEGKEVKIGGGLYDQASLNDSIQLEAVTAKTDAQGNYHIAIPLPVDQMKSFTSLGVIELAVQDGDNTVAAANSEISWDRGDTVQITSTLDGITVPMFVGTGKTPSVTVKVLSLPEKTPIKQRKQTVTLSREYSVEVKGEPYYNEETKKMETPITYESQSEEILKQDVTTNDSGEVTIKVPTTKEGTYTVLITDSSGAWTVQEKHELFYVASMNTVDDLSAANEWVNNVWFEKDMVNVGDKATLFIDSSFRKTTQQLVLMIKTNEVVTWQYIPQDVNNIDIPITKQMTGGMQACILHPMKGYLPQETGAPKFVGNGLNFICAYLGVENKDQKLTVSAEPNESTVKPGQTSATKVKLVDQAGKGVKGVVGVSVVDKALYDTVYGADLTRQIYLDLYKDFFETTTNYSDQGIMSTDIRELLMAYGGRGGGGDGTSGSYRKDFDDNTSWQTNLETNSNGEVLVQIPYNDAITTWVVTVWAVTDDFKVGSTTTEVVAKKDVFLDIDKPKTLREGDEWKSYIRVTNDTTKPFSGTVEVSCDGCLASTVTYSVAIKAGETSEHIITAKTTKTGTLKMKAKVSQNGVQVDGMEIPIQSRPVGFEIPFSKIVKIQKGADEVSFTIPKEGLPTQSSASIIVSQLPIVLSDVLNVDPLYATTPVLSGALATLGTIAEKDLYDSTYLTKDAVFQRAKLYVSELLDRESGNGAFSFDTYTGIDFESSIMAAYALGVANNGFGSALEIDAKTISTVADYLRGEILSNKMTLVLKTKAAYSLAILNKQDAAPLVVALLKNVDRTKLTVEERAYLALALEQVGATADAGKLVTDQEANLSVVGTGTSYINGENRQLLTSAHAYLITKLGLSTGNKPKLEALQNWVLNSCVTCLSGYDQSVVGRLLTGSLLQEEEGSAKKENIELSVNGKSVTKLAYDGARIQVDLPESTFINGENVIKLASDTGKPLFVTLQALVYQTTPVDTATDAANLSISVEGVGSERSIEAGNVGYYKVVVTAKKDMPYSQLSIIYAIGLCSRVLAI